MELDYTPATRQYYDSVEDALRDYRVPVENLPKVREILATLSVGRAYIPTRSRSYIALEGPDGPPNIAWINAGFVDVRGADGTIESIDLPTNSRGGTRGATSGGAKDLEREACLTCFMELPSAGVCGTCD